MVDEMNTRTPNYKSVDQEEEQMEKAKVFGTCQPVENLILMTTNFKWIYFTSTNINKNFIFH